MALNILVGHTGLVSFGHGAWFGLAAYAAALLQRNWMHDSFFGPTIAGVLIVTAVAAAFGFLILRRRGVYFSLLTLALAAMLYAVSFRWTDVTGGENGLGGITRPTLLGFNLESSTNYYWFVAAIAFLILILLWRFHQFDRRQRAGRDPRERAARTLPRLSDQPLQARRVRAVGRDHRARRHPAAVPEPHDVGRSDLGVVLRRSAGDGRDRRHAQFPGPRARARCSSSCSANSWASTPRTGCSGSAWCSSASSCFHRPAWSASASG